MLRIILSIVLMSILSTPSTANNVISIQTELRQEQVEWLNKHRADEDIGNHLNFIYYREESGYIWSVSINEYKKSKHFQTNDLIGYFENVIEERKEKELEILSDILGNALDMLISLIDDGMTEKSSEIITTNTYPQFKIINGMPTVSSNVYKDMSITPNI